MAIEWGMGLHMFNSVQEISSGLTNLEISKK
jgi:hypothetical protein